MQKFLLAFAILLPSLATAKDLMVGSTPAKFNIVKVTASEVKGVSIRLAREITRDDCNRRSINFNLTTVDGNEDVAWYQTAYAAASTMMTEMYCPLPNPVTEKIYSAPVFLKSLINENANGEVKVTLIVPVGYKLEAEEVLK